jgi:AcrR family transcriptional regulator
MEEIRYIPQAGDMYSLGASKGDMATNVAVRVMSEDGWQGVTIRSIARAANVTPQAISAWFPSVAVMRRAIAHRYADRRLRELASRAWHAVNLDLSVERSERPDHEIVGLLPRTWLQETFDRIWLSIEDAARWDDTLAEIVADFDGREWHLVRTMLRGSGVEIDEVEVDLVLALVRGLRAGRCAKVDPLTAAQADAALRRALERSGATA